MYRRGDRVRPPGGPAPAAGCRDVGAADSTCRVARPSEQRDMRERLARVPTIQECRVTRQPIHQPIGYMRGAPPEIVQSAHPSTVSVHVGARSAPSTARITTTADLINTNKG
jgi:hypothetical protein